MFRLAAEIVAGGGRVVTTTTTRIFAAQIALAPAHFEIDRATDAELGAALEQHGHVLVTGPVDATAGKAISVPPEAIARLRALPGRPVVLIEADGARMRPFKAPAEHEPVIPSETTLVVPVVGADIFGRELSDTYVHRAGLVAELAGVPISTAVTPDVVARVLTHPLGGLKNIPAGARVVTLINKVEDEAALRPARETAKLLLENARIHAVAAGAVQQDPPVREVFGRAAAVVLAAGSSSRMGQAKQLLPWPQGGTVLGAVVQRLQDSGVNEIVVVVGQGRAEVEAAVHAAALPGGGRVRTVFNPDFAVAEMARSLAVGLEAVSANVLATLVNLGDQPQVSPEVVAHLLARWRETQAQVVALYYEGQRGHPLLFDRSIWELVRALPASANPRSVLEAAGEIERVDVLDDSILRDLDTPEAYQRELARAAGIID
jgi:molybdenum cofactor cytidylyltransferase